MRLTRSFRTRRPGLTEGVLKTRLSLEALENRTLPDAGSLAGLLTVVQPHAIPQDVPDHGKVNHLPPPPAPPNILVNDPAEDGNSRQATHSETSTVVAGNVIIVGYNDSNQYNGSTLLHFTGLSRSTNSGASFQDLGTLPTTPGGDCGDPTLARDNVTGRVYFATLSCQNPSIPLFRSDDNFTTVMPAVNATPGHSGLLDKEWITVDNASGAGQGNVYLLVRDFGAGNGIYLSRSTNHGDTFTPNGGLAIVTAGAVQGAWITVGPDHAVYAFWYDTGAIRMRKSTDQGQTFGTTVTVTTLTTAGINGDLGLGGFRSNAFPQAVVNPANNQIYVVYDDKGSGSDRADVFFRQSNDGGATWTAARKVNDDSTTRDQWQPSLAVTPDGQHVGVFWYDRRLDSANTMIDRFGVVGTVSGTTVSFGGNQQITTMSFPPVFGQDPVVNGVYMGDYDQTAADNNFFYVVWGDNRDVGPAGRHSNVRFAKVPVVASTGASHYTFDAPASVFAGDTFSITVTAANDVGAADPNYQGTIHFDSTDQAAGLPADYTFTATDAGVHTFDGLQLNTPGNQTITGTDTQTSTLTGAAVITVFHVGASHFTFTAPSFVIIGHPFSITVQATQDDGNVDPNYQGTVTFTSTDQGAGLPADYTFTAQDAGVHTFDNLSLVTQGAQRITATDTQDNTIVGSVAINVTPPALFAPPTNYPVGNGPSSVAVGDFNGDGIPDLAIANNNSNDITILLGNGDGTFRLFGTFTAGGLPNAINAGDFNGDGILDLAVANATTNNVSILLGNGDGSFAPPVNYATGSSPYSAELADFNGDGILDIVTANFGSNTVSVLLGNGDGTFQAAVNYAVGTNPAEVAIGDYNGDGAPDLAVVNEAGTVTILLNNGDGTFHTGGTLTVGAGSQSVFAADLNGDGALDLVTANLRANTVSVLFGNGDGTFKPQVTFAVGAGPAEVAVDDFNGDGNLDIVTANSTGNNVSVLLGNGDGTFQAPQSYPAGAGAFFVVTADLNFDGAPDLIVANSTANTVSILINIANAPLARSGGSLRADGSAQPDATLGTAATPLTSAAPVENPAQRGIADSLDPFAVDEYLGVALSGKGHATSLPLPRLLSRPAAHARLDQLGSDELLDL